MASNSRVASAAQTSEGYGCRSDDLQYDASLHPCTSGSVGAELTSSSLTGVDSSLARLSVLGGALRDPAVLLGEMMRSGTDSSSAMMAIHKYYDAVVANGTSSGSVDDGVASASETSSSCSRKSERTRRWRDEISVLPDEQGCCYLHVIRWGRRKRFLSSLGSYPRLRDFVAALRPGDLDCGAARTLNIYRMPVGFADGLSVVYHVAGESETGECIGSVYDSLACYVRLYPHVNSQVQFLKPDVSVDHIPIVGVIGLSEQPVQTKVDEVILDVSTSSELHVSIAEMPLDDHARLWKHAITRGSYATAAMDHDDAVVKARDVVVQAGDVASARILRLRESRSVLLPDVVSNNEVDAVFLPARSVSVFTNGSVLFTAFGRLHIGPETFVVAESDALVWWLPPLIGDAERYTLRADEGTPYYPHALFGSCCPNPVCYSTGFVDIGDVISFDITPGVHRFDRGDNFNISVDSSVVSSVSCSNGSFRVGSYELVPNVRFGVHSNTVSKVLAIVVSDRVDVDARGAIEYG